MSYVEEMQELSNAKEYDEVDQPKHYCERPITPWEYAEVNRLTFAEGNVVKYVTRHASKDGRKDLEKAIKYIKLIMSIRYPAEEDG